jgi:hypothetical protein
MGGWDKLTTNRRYQPGGRIMLLTPTLPAQRTNRPEPAFDPPP